MGRGLTVVFARSGDAKAFFGLKGRHRRRAGVGWGLYRCCRGNSGRNEHGRLHTNFHRAPTLSYRGSTRKSLFGENRHRGPIFRGWRGKIVTAAFDKYLGGAVTTADRDGGSEELDGSCPIPPRIGIEPGLICVDPTR